MARMLNGTVAGIEGTPLLDYLVPSGMPTAWKDSEFYKHWLRGEAYRLHDASLRAVTGQLLPVALSSSPLPRLQRSMVILALDMSVVRNLYAQLESQAATDALTGLLNRRGFHQALESSLARLDRSGKRMAILYLDLDGFKRINDSLAMQPATRCCVRSAICCAPACALTTCWRAWAGTNSLPCLMALNTRKTPRALPRN